MATSLAQLLAIEKGVRQEDNRVASELYKQLQRGASFQGQTRTYRSLLEGGVQQPDARTQIVADAKTILTDFRAVRARTLDITVTKDVSNHDANANLVVEGVTLAENVPAVTLLALEKHADDMVAFIQALPTLDPTEHWTYDENAGCYRSDPSNTLSTSKEVVPLIIWEPDDPATSKHGPITDKVTKDVPVGEWTVTKFSSALPADRKRQLLDRVRKFREAVKIAREEANRAPVTDVAIGTDIFNWLFAE